MKFPKPCLDCGRLSTGNRCPEHQALIEAQHELRRAQVKKQTKQYSGNYQARAKLVRETATICHLCGDGAKWNDPWEADHLNPGNPNSILLPAHRSCNQKRGNKPATH